MTQLKVVSVIDPGKIIKRKLYFSQMDVKKCQLRPPDSPLSNANYLKYKKRFTNFPNSLLTFIFLIHYSLGQEEQGILMCFHGIFYKREWRMKYPIVSPSFVHHE